MKKQTLQIVLQAREASLVELTVGERVQVDRITSSPLGVIAERHGALLEPGVNTLALAAGHYFLRTLSDAHLRVIRGGLSASIAAQDKDKWPDPPAAPGSEPPIPQGKGDDNPGEQPRFTVE